MDRDDGVARVVLACEERFLSQALQLAPERLDVIANFGFEVAVESEELSGFVVLFRQVIVTLEPLAQAGLLGRDGCRRPRVVPEAWLAHASLELADALGDSFRVKGNHGPRRAGPRSPRALAPAAVRSRPRLVERGDLVVDEAGVHAQAPHDDLRQIRRDSRRPLGPGDPQAAAVGDRAHSGRQSAFELRLLAHEEDDKIGAAPQGRARGRTPEPRGEAVGGARERDNVALLETQLLWQADAGVGVHRAWHDRC